MLRRLRRSRVSGLTRCSFTGRAGSGRLTLLHSIAREILDRDPNFSLVYVTAQQFAEEFIHALQAGKLDQFRRKSRGVGMWLVDDIQFIAGKDKTAEEIFHTFNHLHSLGKQIVLCSDRPPRDLYLMDERLRSRFEAGLVADIQMPDTETRCAILLNKAVRERVELPHDIAMYLAENVPGNIRVLEGALTKLAVQASLQAVPISLELTAEMVEAYYRAGHPRQAGGRSNRQRGWQALQDPFERHSRDFPQGADRSCAAHRGVHHPGDYRRLVEAYRLHVRRPRPHLDDARLPKGGPHDEAGQGPSGDRQDVDAEPVSGCLMKLGEMTWKDVDGVVRDTVIMIPTGSLEQHGLHLSVTGTGQRFWLLRSLRRSSTNWRLP